MDVNIETLLLAIIALEKLIEKLNQERNKRFEKSKSKYRVEKIAKVYSILSELNSEIGSDRMLRFMYHNGGKLANGDSMNKLSIFNDIHAPRLGSVSQLFQNVLFERVPAMIGRISANGSVYYTHETVEDDALRLFFRLSGIKNFYIHSIVKKSKIIGFVAAVSNEKNKPITEKDQLKIANAVIELKKLL